MSNATTTEVLNKGLKRQFHVEVPSDHVQKNVDLLIREKGKKYKENGFRPGKVPLARLQEIFGGAVLEDAIKQTVQQTVAAFLKEKQLNPVLKPEYTVESYDDEKGLSYKIDLELFPEVPEISEEGLEIQKVSCRISEKEVEDFVIYLGHNLHEFPQLDSRRRNLCFKTTIHRLIGGGMMHPGTNPADAVDNLGHFFGRPSLDKFLETPQGHHVQASISHITVIIQLDGDPGMTLDAG